MSSFLLERRPWVLYFSVYATISIVLFMSFYKIEAKTLRDLIKTKNKYVKISVILNILSIAGLPPFSGFIIKISVLAPLRVAPVRGLLVFLITATLISLYFYIRIIYVCFVYSVVGGHKNKTHKYIVIANLFTLPLG